MLPDPASLNRQSLDEAGGASRARTSDSSLRHQSRDPGCLKSRAPVNSGRPQIRPTFARPYGFEIKKPALRFRAMVSIGAGAMVHRPLSSLREVPPAA